MPDSVTGFSIFSSQDLSGNEVRVGHRAYTLHTQADMEIGGFVSQLFLVDTPLAQVVLLPRDTWPLVYIDCYKGGYGPGVAVAVGQARANGKAGTCAPPPIIPQSVWRQGLKAPKPGPGATKVAHVVIHHSATSNTATDYLLAVRNIYLYHVNYNGWDDVGYNYLITADGSVWAGRDGQGMVDGDNVKGAHFCAKNSGTMGVCLVGDFTLALPSDTALGSLRDLLAWKLEKEGLQPFGQSFHPTGAGDGFELPTLCGHRDGHRPGVYGGCQTECPGDQVYVHMDSLRAAVANRLVSCGYAVGSDRGAHPVETEATYLDIGKEAQVYDLYGRWVGSLVWQGQYPSAYSSGWYILSQVQGEEWVRAIFYLGLTN
jgi:hypothetical protein